MDDPACVVCNQPPLFEPRNHKSHMKPHELKMMLHRAERLRVYPETLSCFFRGCRCIAIIEVWCFGRMEPLDHDVDVADLNHGGT